MARATAAVGRKLRLEIAGAALMGNVRSNGGSIVQ
jgi:hypothetical protein